MDNIELYNSISIPSAVNSYSIAMEYMKQWFLSKFNKNYFKTIQIDGKHILDDFRNFTITESLKKEKPSVAIIPQPQLDFDRDRLDLYQGGLNQYIRRSKLETSFFKDKEKNMYLGIALEQLQVNFTYRIRVGSRAQQIDLYKFMQMAFRIGSTQGEDVDMDFHIPYSVMLQVAQDAGFEINDDKIVNVLDFVSYLNSHSIIPILFKFRTINGKSEFFLRFKEVYMHISCLDPLSADEGEREGMLLNNFIIEMNVTLQMPCPKMYMYYSTVAHDKIEYLDTNNSGFGLFSIKTPNIPDTNNNGWSQYLTTECFEEDITKNLFIEFKELFENSDLEKVINHTKRMNIDPSIFIDIKIFNDDKELTYGLDWDNMTILTNEIPTSNTSNICIYVDLEYMAKELINIEDMNRDRIRV